MTIYFAFAMHDDDIGVIGLFCIDAKVTEEFATEKMWDDAWKLDFLKRHLSSN